MTLSDAAALAGIGGLVVTLATIAGNLVVRSISGRRRREQLKRLALLRVRAVNLRNDAIVPGAITTPEQLADWIKERDAWHREARRDRTDR